MKKDYYPNLVVMHLNPKDRFMQFIELILRKGTLTKF